MKRHGLSFQITTLGPRGWYHQPKEKKSQSTMRQRKKGETEKREKG